MLLWTNLSEESLTVEVETSSVSDYYNGGVSRCRRAQSRHDQRMVYFLLDLSVLDDRINFPLYRIYSPWLQSLQSRYSILLQLAAFGDGKNFRCHTFVGTSDQFNIPWFTIPFSTRGDSLLTGLV
jgi:hypothetical protein